MFGILRKVIRELEPNASQARGADRYEKRLDRFATCAQICQAGFN